MIITLTVSDTRKVRVNTNAIIYYIVSDQDSTYTKIVTIRTDLNLFVLESPEDIDKIIESVTFNNRFEEHLK